MTWKTGIAACPAPCSALLDSSKYTRWSSIDSPSMQRYCGSGRVVHCARKRKPLVDIPKRVQTRIWVKMSWTNNVFSFVIPDSGIFTWTHLQGTAYLDSVRIVYDANAEVRRLQKFLEELAVCFDTAACVTNTGIFSIHCKCCPKNCYRWTQFYASPANTIAILSEIDWEIERHRWSLFLSDVTWAAGVAIFNYLGFLHSKLYCLWVLFNSILYFMHFIWWCLLRRRNIYSDKIRASDSLRLGKDSFRYIEIDWTLMYINSL